MNLWIEEAKKNSGCKEWDIYGDGSLLGRIEHCYNRYTKTYSYSVSKYEEATSGYSNSFSCVGTENLFISARELLLKHCTKKADATTTDVRFLLEDEESEFFPTPSSLAGKMFEGFKFGKIKTILEPSAGKGDLVNWFRKAFKNISSMGNNPDIDCIEIDKNLRSILEANGEKVVFDDFISFTAYKRYDLIVMNPPFSVGAAHLLKALDIQKKGGSVICLLNAETIRNPYTQQRKTLLALLTKYGAKIRFVENSFCRAERKTDVEVAIIQVTIPDDYGESKIFEGLKKAAVENTNDGPDITYVCSGDYITRIISQYEVEVNICKEFIREYFAIKKYIPVNFPKGDSNDNWRTEPVLKLTTGSNSCDLNECIQTIRLKYWRELLTREEIISKFTKDLQTKYHSMIDEMKDFDFNRFNIEKVFANMNAELIPGVEAEIHKVFNTLTKEHAWYPECKNNIHYFNGWRTNCAHKLNQKVIIPAYNLFEDSKWKSSYNKSSFRVRETYDALIDIEKVLDYLDGSSSENSNLYNILSFASAQGFTKNIDCKYFSINVYKKGTIHIAFRKEYAYLIDALNIFVCKGNNWLPPFYGKVDYDNLDDEAKAVIDDFQGKTAYEEVVANPEKYLCEISSNKILLLA